MARSYHSNQSNFAGQPPSVLILIVGYRYAQPNLHSYKIPLSPAARPAQISNVGAYDPVPLDMSLFFTVMQTPEDA